ncbi:MAG: metallophosphoesterase [Planctomycetaceae bacterium]|jgi:UDP-2,3-diacylglucosamine pyrophosphatase LpxH/endonuclease/exonuclease/phosphatase family metal-dependent hydrolase|nr:metallophosphoesterase [Planctomycetaceae bacterium]
MKNLQSTSRRNFLKTGAVASAATMTSLLLANDNPSNENSKSFAAQSDSNSNAQSLSVLQINVWISTSIVPKGTQMLINLIDNLNPDIVLLCELDNGKLIKNLVNELKNRKKNYYQDNQNIQTGILSKFPLQKSSILTTTNEPYSTQINKHRAVTKSYITVGEKKITIYSAHLDWEKYAPRLPRGYDLSKKIEKPIIDADQITIVNRESLRHETIKKILPDIKKEIAKGQFVILGGDFNEPSHLDWKENTKTIHEHNGAVVNWDVSIMLENSGLIDAYRQRYPNAITHPGFTWSSANPVAEVKGFSLKDADERDRIDFIYYSPQTGIELTSANIVGPAASVLHGKITDDKETDSLLTQPADQWFSDHKGNLTTFHFSSNKIEKKSAGRKMTFAFLTDIHLDIYDRDDCYNGFLQSLNRVKDTDAEFIIIGGDSVDITGGKSKLTREQIDAMYVKFKKTMDNTGKPYYVAIGNHDRYFNKDDGNVGGDEIFKNYFGQSYQTFEKKGIRFFLINSVQATSKGGLSVGDEQLEWLKKELVRIPLATPIVLVTHVPIYSIYYPVVTGQAKGNDIISNFKEVLSVFRQHNLQLVLQGHMHLYEEIFSQNVQYVTGGAISATWWKGSFHGTEEGFLLVNVDNNNNIAWDYEDYGWSPK